MSQRPTRSTSIFLMILTAFCLACLSGIAVPNACRAADAARGNIVSIPDASEGMAARVRGKVKVEKPEQSLGKVIISALRNGKPVRANCTVFRAAEANEEGERETVAEGRIEGRGAIFKLTPGVYDIMVQNEEDSNRPVVDFAAVAVEAGKNIEKVAEFSGGSLKLRALRNGKPSRAYCIVYKAEAEEDKEKEVAAEGWIESEAVLSFKLSPGLYDIKITNEEDANRPVAAFPATPVEAGKSVEKTAVFSGGALKVKALRNGRPVRAYWEISTPQTDGKAGEKVVDNWVDVEGFSFKLVPGVYDAVVRKEESEEKKEIKALTIEAGKTRIVDAEL